MYACMYEVYEVYEDGKYLVKIEISYRNADKRIKRNILIFNDRKKMENREYILCVRFMIRIHISSTMNSVFTYSRIISLIFS